MRHRSLAAFFLVLFSSYSSFAIQQSSPPHWPVCAELDAAAVWDIEEAGQTQQIAGEKLADAFFLVMKARRACEEGRLSDAVAIYDEVSFD